MDDHGETAAEKVLKWALRAQIVASIILVLVMIYVYIIKGVHFRSQ